MLNMTEKLVVYLDPETLKYMFLNYTKERNYPVMTKLYTLLHEGYVNDLIVTPLTFEHVYPYIQDNKIPVEYLNMMGDIGQLQCHLRFTVRTLQLIRVINSFFELDYKKPIWRDAFSSDPDERTKSGFNKYLSISASNVMKAMEREKNNSQVYYFIESFKEKKPKESIAGEYYAYVWKQFPDLIKPHLPLDGDPEDHVKRFLSYEDIRDIPEFHIISNILYPLFETYGIQEIEYGRKDDLLLSAEKMAAYMPYCNYYVTTADVTELVSMIGINEPYNVLLYDDNESSLYRLIDDLTNAVNSKSIEKKKKETRTIFRKPR